MPRKPAYIASEMLPMSALVGRLAALRHEWQSAIARGLPSYEQEQKQRNYERVKAIYDARVAAGEAPVPPSGGLASINRVRAAEAACDQTLRDLHSEFTQSYREARGYVEYAVRLTKDGSPPSRAGINRAIMPMAHALRRAADRLEQRFALLHETLHGVPMTPTPHIPPQGDSTATPSPHPLTADEDPSVPPPPEPDMDDYFDSIEPPPAPNT